MMRAGLRTNLTAVARRFGPPRAVQYRCRSSKASRRTDDVPNSTAPPPPPTAHSKPGRSRLVYAWYGLVLFGGVSLGLTVRNFVMPALPVPGSREDELALKALTSDIDQLDVVKWMRSQSRSADDEEGNGKSWVELDANAHIAESNEDKGRTTRPLTSQTLAGSKGLGVQRAFWNAETKELVSVVWIGTAMSGWPTLAHGGLILTIFEDCMSRMVAGPDAPLDSTPRPTSMSIIYAKPTYSTNFYVLRANYSKPNLPQAAPPQDSDPAPAKSWLPSWKDFTKKEQQPESAKTVELIGTLESIDGELTVRVKGTFPLSH